jgi:hypothetical protein
MGSDDIERQRSVDSPTVTGDLRSGPDASPHRDEGTPATDAAAGQTEHPVAADSSVSAGARDAHPADAGSALARDEGHALALATSPPDEYPRLEAPGEYPRLAAPDEPPRLAAGPTDERSGSPATSLPDQAHDAPLDWTNSAPDSASDVIQVVDTAGDLPPVIQAQLRPSDIEAMGFPVEIHDRMMSGGESFEKFAHYGWNDADQTSERQALRVPHDPAHPMTWVREPEEGKEEVFFDGIQNILQTERGQQLTGAEVRQLGRDFVPSDPHESLALARQFDGDHSREEARNARYTLSFEPGAHVTYIKSTVAPQDSPLENRGAELPGGASQILLLDYEAERSSITVSPVGGRVQFDEDGLMRFGYRDRKLPS